MKSLFIPLLALSLSACIKAPTLDEKLADASSPAERNEILYSDCLQYVNYPIPGGHTRQYMGHEARQWALCDEMKKLNQHAEK